MNPLIFLVDRYERIAYTIHVSVKSPSLIERITGQRMSSFALAGEFDSSRNSKTPVISCLCWEYLRPIKHSLRHHLAGMKNLLQETERIPIALCFLSFRFKYERILPHEQFWHYCVFTIFTS